MHTTVCAFCALCVSSGATGALIDISGGVPLSDVVGNEFRVEDKLFRVTSFSTPPKQFQAQNITVIPYVAGDPLAGVGFDLTGGFQDFVRGDGSISEFNLQYTVEIVDNPDTPGVDESINFFIVDNILAFNGNAGGQPGSFTRVDESVFNHETGALLGQKEVFDVVRGDGGHDIQREDRLVFDPLRKIEINKDAKFFAATDCCDATASFIRQSFSQIPSPGTAVVLGALGMVAIRRRR